MTYASHVLAGMRVAFTNLLQRIRACPAVASCGSKSVLVRDIEAIIQDISVSGAYIELDYDLNFMYELLEDDVIAYERCEARAESSGTSGGKTPTDFSISTGQKESGAAGEDAGAGSEGSTGSTGSGSGSSGSGSGGSGKTVTGYGESTGQKPPAGSGAMGWLIPVGLFAAAAYFFTRKSGR